MHQALFMMTIGPVQSFISEARKLKDLYAGSYLLSYIVKKMVDDLLEQPTVKMIFPSQGSESMPNKFICEISYEKEEEQVILAERLSCVAKNCLREIANFLKKKHNFESSYFDEEIESFLEIYWISKEYTVGDDVSYQRTYQQMVKELNEIKCIKIFPYTKQPSGINCSISNNKRALFSFNKKVLIDKGILLDSKKYKGKIGEHERLSSMAFLKRFLDDTNIIEKDSYRSVSHISLGNRLSSIGLNKEELSDSVANGIYSYLGNKTFEQELSDEEKMQINKITSQIKLNSLTPYYAVIKFDGDSIGTLYREPDLKKNCSMKEFHIYLSDKITEFAKQVRSMILPHEGKIVYAGGEDFLGFVSLDTLFNKLILLRNSFGKIDISKYIENGKMTFSAGIVIAHNKEDLQEVMQEVSKAEIYAKEIDVDKDACSITLLPRGNGKLSGRLKFGNNCENLLCLQKTLEMLKNKEISNSFIYKLKDSLEQLERERVSDTFINEMIKLETTRLLSINSKSIGGEDWKLLETFRKSVEGRKEYEKWLSILGFLQREVKI